MLVVEAIGDQIVDRAAAIVQQQRVLRPSRLDPVEIVGEHLLEKRQDAGAADVQPPHVRNVEDPRRAAHRQMLGDHSLVLHRHLVPGEGDESGARLDMAVVERCTQEAVAGHVRT